jgi:NAD(P)-dependent dehydrogenase (short-subunit alcohol dehydrogenase family)
MNVQDNVFIVTGAASGLGAATADALASSGGIVVGVDVKPGSDRRLIWQGIDVAEIQRRPRTREEVQNVKG